MIFPLPTLIFGPYRDAAPHADVQADPFAIVDWSERPACPCERCAGVRATRAAIVELDRTPPPTA